MAPRNMPRNEQRRTKDDLAISTSRLFHTWKSRPVCYLRFNPYKTFIINFRQCLISLRLSPHPFDLPLSRSATIRRRLVFFWWRTLPVPFKVYIIQLTNPRVGQMRNLPLASGSPGVSLTLCPDGKLGVVGIGRNASVSLKVQYMLRVSQPYRINPCTFLLLTDV
jgi:hypothetical protein